MKQHTSSTHRSVSVGELLLGHLGDPETPIALGKKLNVPLPTLLTALSRMFDKGRVLKSRRVPLFTDAGRILPHVYYLRDGKRRDRRCVIYDSKLGVVKEETLHFYTKEELEAEIRRPSEDDVYKAIKEFEREYGKSPLANQLNETLKKKGFTFSRDTLWLIQNRLMKKGRVKRVGKVKDLGRITKIPNVGYAYATEVKLGVKAIEEFWRDRRTHYSRVKEQVEALAELGQAVEFKNLAEALKIPECDIYNICYQTVERYPNIKMVKRAGRNLIYDSTRLTEKDLDRITQRVERRESEDGFRRALYGKALELIHQTTWVEMVERHKWAISNYNVFPNLYIPKNPFVRQLDILAKVEYIPNFKARWVHYFPAECKALAGGMEETKGYDSATDTETRTLVRKGGVTSRIAERFYNQLRYHTYDNRIRLKDSSYYWSGAETVLTEVGFNGSHQKTTVHVLKANVTPVIIGTGFTQSAKMFCRKHGLLYIYADSEIRQLGEWLGKELTLRKFKTKYKLTPTETWRGKKSQTTVHDKTVHERLKEWFFKKVLESKIPITMKKHPKIRKPRHKCKYCKAYLPCTPDYNGSITCSSCGETQIVSSMVA